MEESFKSPKIDFDDEDGNEEDGDDDALSIQRTFNKKNGQKEV